jgi:hypothetical protein
MPAPNGLKLYVTHTAKEDRCVLKLERGQGAAYRVLCPALGVSLDGISEATVEGDK